MLVYYDFIKMRVRAIHQDWNWMNMKVSIINGGTFVAYVCMSTLPYYKYYYLFIYRYIWFRIPIQQIYGNGYLLLEDFIVLFVSFIPLNFKRIITSFYFVESMKKDRQYGYFCFKKPCSLSYKCLFWKL